LFKVLAQDYVYVCTLGVFEGLEVAGKDAKHGTGDAFFYYVVIWLSIQVVLNGSEQLLYLARYIRLRPGLSDHRLLAFDPRKRIATAWISSLGERGNLPLCFLEGTCRIEHLVILHTALVE